MKRSIIALEFSARKWVVELDVLGEFFETLLSKADMCRPP